MRRRSQLVIGSVIVAVVVAGLPEPASSHRATRCGSGKVLHITNGRQSCVSASRYRLSTTPNSLLGAELRRLLPGGPVKPRLRNGRLASKPLSRAVVSAIVRRYSAAEPTLLTAVSDALAGGTPYARPHGLGSTTATVTVNPSTGSTSGSLGFGGTTGGSTVNGTAGLTVDPSGRSGASLDVKVTDGDGSRSFGFEVSLSPRTTLQCPDANGNLDLSSDDQATTRTTQTFGSDQLSLGKIVEAIRVRVRASAHVTFDGHGRARPFALSVSASLAYKRTARVLFLHNRSTASATGSISGTLNPRTGAISGGTVRSSAHTSGFDGDQAANDATVAAAVEKMVTEEVARLLKAVRDAERRCGHYEVTLALTTTGDFATHLSTGVISATFIARRDQSHPDTGPFMDSVQATYEQLVFTSRIPECTFENPVSTTRTLSVTIDADPDAGTATVAWAADPAQGGLFATATIVCPGSEIAGQPGPALVGVLPRSFVVPFDGGPVVVSGGLSAGGGGWTHSGLVTVQRVRG